MSSECCVEIGRDLVEVLPTVLDLFQIPTAEKCVAYDCFLFTFLFTGGTHFFRKLLSDLETDLLV